MGWRVIAVAAVLAVLVALGVHRETRARLQAGWHRLGWRWLTGAAWHGNEVSGDAWAWPGPWFWKLPRPRRAAIRIAVTLAAAGLPAAWLADPWLTSRLAMSAASLLCAAAAAAAVAGVKNYRHRRRWVRPLHRRTAAMIGMPMAGPLRHITIPRDRTGAVIRLPQDFTTDVAGRAEIVRTVAETVGIEQPEASWRLAGPAPMVTITSSQPPPAMVTLAQLRPLIERGRPDELLWGLGKKSVVVKSSLSGDSPHLGLSMGSGAGKSLTARAILAQMLFHGAIGLILDCKMISHQWARDLPNVAIVRRAHEIHDALLWLGGEVHRRNEVALHGADMDGNVHAVVGPRLIVVAEELNATMKLLRMHWRQVRDTDKSLPVRSPALDSFDVVNLMGRQVLMNIVYIGQKLSAKAGGGDGDIRESIGVVAFGRYTPSNWKMLAGDHAMPPASRKPGRIQVVSDSVRETQALFLPAREARELATAGEVTPLPAGMPGAAVLVGQHAAVSRPEQPVVSQTRTAATGLVTLRQFHESGGARSLGALQRASTRPGFPPKRGQDGLAALYDELDLAAFAAGEYEPVPS